MSRWPTFLLMAVLLGTAPVLMAHGTCSGDDDVDGVEFSVDAEVRFHDGDLVFERDDVEVARFTQRNELIIDGEPVTTGAAGRREIAGYRNAYERLLTDAKEIGLVSARLGISAAMRAVAAVFTGDADEVEAEIEAEAEAIEELAEALCDSVNDLRDHHVALSEAVPEFGAAVPLKD